MKCIPVFNIDKYKYKYNKCNFTLYKMILIITKILFMKLYQISLKMFYDIKKIKKDITKNSIIGTRNYF